MATIPTGFSAQSQGLPPTSPAVMPQFLQIRFNGVDLGGPDADTLDFVGTGFTLIRGTGVDANKITVTLT